MVVGVIKSIQDSQKLYIKLKAPFRNEKGLLHYINRNKLIPAINEPNPAYVQSHHSYVNRLGPWLTSRGRPSHQHHCDFQ